jgi:uncharacterized protein (DUF2252 family)
MKLADAVDRYERWLAGFMPLHPGDLDRKHALMKSGPFAFLRATFFRWSSTWSRLAPDERHAPAVLGVGDLHLENFGTWRDAEGRLIWGINDFDEATRLPYSQDLIRLTASAYLAIEGAHLTLRRRQAARAIAEGYAHALATGGRPFVLEEDHAWLRAIATSRLRDPVGFWQKLSALRTTRAPAAVRRLLSQSLPRPGLRFRVAHRVAGLGSLGRPRFVALATVDGGSLAREAKALAPSAWDAGGGGEAGPIRYATILARAVRAPDPSLRVVGPWVVRRLAPHCTRIEVTELTRARDEDRLLYAMGFETANVHLGTPGSRAAILRHLRRRAPDWLHGAAKPFVDAVLADWQEWRKHSRKRAGGAARARSR